MVQSPIIGDEQLTIEFSGINREPFCSW